MKLLYLLLTSLSLLGVEPLKAASDSYVRSTTSTEQKLDVPTEGLSVPMSDFGGRPTVQVKINGKGPYPFIFDTGALSSVVDSGLANELSLPESDDGDLINQLQIGGAILHDLPVHAGPISAMFGQNDAPRGVFSALSFPGYLVTFDFPEKQITIRKGSLKEPDNKAVFAYRADDELPIVPVKVAGHPMRVHLDTGAPFSLSLPTKYKNEVPLTGPSVESHKARTHAGEFPVYKGTVAGEIEIGGYKLPNHEVLFTDVVPHPGATPQGQVGGATLRDFVVTLDSQNRRVQFAQTVGLP